MAEEHGKSARLLDRLAAWFRRSPSDGPRQPSCLPHVHMQTIRVRHTYGSAGLQGCDLIVPGQLFTTPVRALRKLRKLSCAVVASSGVLHGARCGSAIDAHDAVMRMNAAPTQGFEADVGNRTSLMVLNSHLVRELNGCSRGLVSRAPALAGRASRQRTSSSSATSGPPQTMSRRQRGPSTD